MKCHFLALLLFAWILLGCPLLAQSRPETIEEDYDVDPQIIAPSDEIHSTTMRASADVVVKPSSTTWMDLGATSTTDGLRLFSNSSSVMYLTPSGQVGVGNASPNYPFEVFASQGDRGARVQLQTFIAADVTQYDIATMSYSFQDVASGVTNNGYAMGANTVGYLTGAGWVKNTYGIRSLSGTMSSATGHVQTAFGGYFRVINGGSFGGSSIGNGMGLYVEDVEATNGWGIYQVGSNDANYFAGNVGIGIASPQTRFHIKDSATYTTTDETNNRNILIEGFGNDDGGGIVWKSRNGKDAVRIVAESSGGSNKQNLVFYTNGAGDYTSPAVPSMVLDKNGRIGIGTTTPAEALHVTGNAVFGGTVTGTNIQAQYQDLAEWVPSTEALSAGTVVTVDPENPNHVVASGRAYDTRVAGVVSAQPGLLLGEAGERKLKVATTGRLKVKVDATKAPIRLGDLLVTSGVPGVAMRSEPVEISGIEMHRPGTLVGKALESLDSGRGEILVLLSLQ